MRNIWNNLRLIIYELQILMAMQIILFNDPLALLVILLIAQIICALMAGGCSLIMGEHPDYMFTAFVLTIVVKAIISIVTPEYGTVASVIQSIVALAFFQTKTLRGKIYGKYNTYKRTFRNQMLRSLSASVDDVAWV